MESGRRHRHVSRSLYNMVGTLSCGDKKEEAMTLSLKLPVYIRALLFFFILSLQKVLILIVHN